MFHLLIAVTLIIAGCFWGSVIDFSEQDIKGKENEIFNSGFEEAALDVGTVPVGWTVLNDVNNSISIDSDVFSNGKKSLKISHPARKVSLISDSFPIDAEAIYFSRCFLKTNYQSNHEVEIMFVAFDAKGKQTNRFKIRSIPQENWTKANMTTSFFKQNACFGRIIISFPARADKIFWLDDMECYNVYEMKQ